MKSSTVWLLALSAALALVKLTRIGPVILVVSERHGWGVHSGDLLAFLPLTAAGLQTLRSRRKIQS